MGIIKRNFANNILSTGTFDATKLTGDIPTANLSANAPATDLNPLRNDVATLALREAVNSNRIGTNLVNSFIDQFEDASGIDTTTDTARNASEYVSSAATAVQAFASDANTTLLLHMDNNVTDTSGNQTPTNNSVTFNTSTKKFGTHSAYFNGSANLRMETTAFDYTGDYTIESWFYPTDLSTNNHVLFHKWDGTPSADNQALIFGYFSTNWQTYINLPQGQGGWTVNGNSDNFNVGPISTGQWYHMALTKESSTTRLYLDGVQKATTTNSYGLNTTNCNKNDIGGSTIHGRFTGYIDEFRISNVCRYPSGTTFTPSEVTNVSATGNFTSTTINPADSTARTKLGLIVLYKDNAGTNALNTDIVAQVSADNGSNYSTCTLTPRGNFDSSGTKIAIANDVTVTSGTDLKYKISFANQSDGSKEARITGVSLIY